MILNIVNLIVLALLLVSCKPGVKVIRETPILVVGDPVYKKEESVSLEKLEEYSKSIEPLSDSMAAVRASIDDDKQKLDAIYDILIHIDLFDTVREVGVAESKKYHEFLFLVQKILDQIDPVDLESKITEMEELVDLAESEEKRVIDSAKVRKRVDEIASRAKIAVDDNKRIDAVAKSVASQKRALSDKIDDAAQNFGTQSDHKKVAAIDVVSGKIAGTKSLQEIDGQIFKDPQFFSLLAEIKRVPVYGQKVEEFFEDDLPKKPAKVQAEIRRIIAEAKAQKKAIDSYFAVGSPQPSSQDDVDRLVNRLGMILDTADFNHFISSRGVLRVETARQNEISKIMDPPAIVSAFGAPPPPLTPKPKNILENFKSSVANIRDRRLAGATVKLNSYFSNLSNFYSIPKVAVIKAAVKDAGDDKSARYQPSYESLSDAVMPFTVDGLRSALDKGGKVQGSENEVEFYRNFIKIMKSKVSDVLFKDLLLAVNQKIDNRVKYLKDWVLNNHPSMRAIEDQFAQLDPIDKKVELRRKCDDINVALALVFKRAIDCPGIFRELDENYAAADTSRPLWEQGLLNKAKDRIKAVFYTKSEIIRGAGGKEEQVKIDVAGKEEQHDIPKGVTDLKHAINTFNDEFLNAAAAIDFNTLPNNFAYDNQSLIQHIVLMLKTHKIGEGRKGVLYGDVIGSYTNELFRGMTPGDIMALGAKIDRTSTDRLAKLHVVLSPSGYQEVVQPFARPAEDVLVANMKRAALGRVDDATIEGAGIPDFERALADVYSATDDAGTHRAITTLANFFRDDVPEFRDRVLAAAAITGVDNSANFGLLGQLGPIKTAVENHHKYKALEAIANLDGNAPENIMIVDDAGSLEDRSTKVSDTLRLVIFGADGGERRIVSLFKELRAAIEQALAALRSEVFRGQLPPNHPGVIEPIANAFSLIFAYPLSELNALKFDGSDDPAIAQAFAAFNTKYAEKFVRLKTVITNAHTGNGATREIFKILEGYNYGGLVRPGLKDKLSAGSSSPETVDLNHHLGNFLR